MIILITQNSTSLTTNIFLINQLIDIVLYGWVLMIMCKRVICRGLDLRWETILTSIKTRQFTTLTRSKFKQLLSNYHYISELLLLIASVIAVCQFSNQYYSYSIQLKTDNSLLARLIPWMLFHLLLTISIIVKYRKSQPILFTKIGEEIKRKIWRKKLIEV